MLQDRSSAVLVLFLNMVGRLLSRPKWSCGNVMYRVGTSSQRANRLGWPMNIFALCIQ